MNRTKNMQNCEWDWVSDLCHYIFKWLKDLQRFLVSMENQLTWKFSVGGVGTYELWTVTW